MAQSTRKRGRNRHIEDISDSVLQFIFQLCDSETLVNASQVCKRFQKRLSYSCLRSILCNRALPDTPYKFIPVHSSNSEILRLLWCYEHVKSVCCTALAKRRRRMYSFRAVQSPFLLSVVQSKSRLYCPCEIVPEQFQMVLVRQKRDFSILGAVPVPFGSEIHIFESPLTGNVYIVTFASLRVCSFRIKDEQLCTVPQNLFSHPTPATKLLFGTRSSDGLIPDKSNLMRRFCASKNLIGFVCNEDSLIRVATLSDETCSVQSTAKPVLILESDISPSRAKALAVNATSHCVAYVNDEYEVNVICLTSGNILFHQNSIPLRLPRVLPEVVVNLILKHGYLIVGSNHGILFVYKFRKDNSVVLLTVSQDESFAEVLTEGGAPILSMDIHHSMLVTNDGRGYGLRVYNLIANSRTKKIDCLSFSNVIEFSDDTDEPPTGLVQWSHEGDIVYMTGSNGALYIWDWVTPPFQARPGIPSSMEKLHAKANGDWTFDTDFDYLSIE
jgi:hypothetical protein